MKLMKRTVAAILIIATVIGSLCFSVSAADANTPTAKGLEIQKIMKKHYSGGIWSDLKRSGATAVIVLKERLKLK